MHSDSNQAWEELHFSGESETVKLLNFYARYLFQKRLFQLFDMDLPYDGGYFFEKCDVFVVTLMM